MRALISVSNKTGVVELADFLVRNAWQILSTGGTAKAIRDARIRVVDISEYTRFPEMMDGRLKTLHPLIHGGILGRLDVDQEVMRENGILPINLVVVNFYPFEKTVENLDCDLDTAIENIDIGGPTMVRAAGKNWRRVGVVVDPQDYPSVIEEIKQLGHLSEAFRFRLMKRAFRTSAMYERAIITYLSRLAAGSR